MHILVVYNPKAGMDFHGEQPLIQEIERAGHTTTLISAKEEQWDLECDAIAVAGGDGTLEKVLRHLGGKDIPLAIIPRGTANNVAKSFGIHWTAETAQEFWHSLADGHRPTKRLSVGRVCYAQQKKFFIESVGCGLLAHLIATDKETKAARRSTFGNAESELRHRASVLHETLQDYQATEYTLTIDGNDYSGRYLLIEAMNIARVGPGLELVPEADPGDATVEVVLVRHHEKELLSHYLSGVANGGRPVSPFARVPGSRIKLYCNASALHIDDKCLSRNQRETFEVQAAVQQLTILN